MIEGHKGKAIEAYDRAVKEIFEAEQEMSFY